MTCTACGHNVFHPESVTESFATGGSLVVVEQIPAQVCSRCGEANFSAEVAERVRRLVHGPHHPVRTVTAQVLDYRAA